MCVGESRTRGCNGALADRGMSAELLANAADAASSSDFADATDAARPPNGLATTPPPRGALVLLCGLPAAGKSTLAARLLSDGPSALHAALGAPSPPNHCESLLLA